MEMSPALLTAVLSQKEGPHHKPVVINMTINLTTRTVDLGLSLTNSTLLVLDKF